MKFLIVAVCALAFSSANPVVYKGPLHYPVIYNGVPTETAEVQHAKAIHYDAIAKEVARPGFQTYQEPKYEDQSQNGQISHQQPRYEQSYNTGYSQNVAQYETEHSQNFQQYVPTYETGYVSQYTQKQVEPISHVIPEIGHDGKPLDTAEVEAAKAKHFAAVYQALERAAAQKPQYRHRRGIYEHAPIYTGPQHIPVITKGGVPEDTLEVQHARAEHLAALSAVDVKGYNGYTLEEENVKYKGPQHIPVITKGGVPVDTVEVQKARSEHLAAISADKLKGTFGFSIHQQHAPAYGYQGHEVPVIGHKGIPLDTAEVEHAKSAHFAAHQEALARNSKSQEYYQTEEDYHHHY